MPKTVTITAWLIFIFSISIAGVQAFTPQSDYEYQLTQYRKHNTEFKSLKEVNQKTPTLDNQQKALQAAKQTIISRDQAKISYIEIILNSINLQNLDQDYINQTKKDLVSAQEFYKNKINLAKDIINTEDLAGFTQKYLEDQPPYQNQIIKAQAAKKLAILIRQQINIKNAYDDLLPKISDKTLKPVSAGLTKINQLADSINLNITQNINTVKDSQVAYSSRSSFYSKQSEGLNQIKTLQVQLVNILLDLEKNYVN